MTNLLTKTHLKEESQRFLEEITAQKTRSTSFVLDRNTVSKQKISPLLLGAVSAQTYFHEDGEFATALAAEQQGIPFIVSSHSSYSLEEIREIAPTSELWFQAHIFKDRVLSKHFVQRAELAGYQAIVISLSNDVIHHQADQLEKGIANFVVDPIFATKNYQSEIKLSDQIEAEYLDRHITWEDIHYLKQYTTLPVYVYGEFTFDEVRNALKQNVDGLIFTNVNQTNIDFLQKVKTVVGDVLSIIIETDVQTKEELNELLYNGADAVSIQKEYVVPLAESGSIGVEKVIDQLFT